MIADQSENESNLKEKGDSIGSETTSDVKWDISRLSAGEMSALKRNAGIMMASASMKAQAAFFRAKNVNCKTWEEEYCFPAVCMQCLWRESEVRRIKQFPEMLRDIYQDVNATESTRKRCTEFLDYAWGEDGFLLGKICRLVRRLQTDNPDIRPDFEALAKDFMRWKNPTRIVQKKWLRTICRNK